MTSGQRYGKSALGDFYIEMFRDHEIHGSCCWAGGAPHLNAPQLCARDEFGEKLYCYVKAQPQNEDDLRLMIEAAWASEFRCLRYAGEDKEIIQRLIDIGIAYDICDIPLPKGLLYKLRNFCTIEENTYSKRSVEDVAYLLQKFFLNSLREPYQVEVTEPEQIGNNAIGFTYTWTWISRTSAPPLTVSTKIVVKSCPTDFSDWLITHSLVEEHRGISMSLTIDDFLRKSEEFTNFRWYSESEWQNGDPNFWRSTPY